MSNCQLCDDNIFDDDEEWYKDVMVCKKCQAFLEEHDQVDGKLIVDRCKECGHIKSVWFEKYKPRGRKIGSKNKPKAPKNQAVLDV